MHVHARDSHDFIFEEDTIDCSFFCIRSFTLLCQSPQQYKFDSSECPTCGYPHLISGLNVDGGLLKSKRKRMYIFGVLFSLFFLG